MKTANELHAIADAVNAAKEARKARAKEKAEEMALQCEFEAKKGRHHCKLFCHYHNKVNEELIIDELKAHNYEVIVEGCNLIVRW